MPPLDDEVFLSVRGERARRLHAIAVGFAYAQRRLKNEIVSDLAEHRAWLVEEFVKIKLELVAARAEIERLRAITTAVDMTRDGQALN